VADIAHGVVDKFDAVGNATNFAALASSALDGRATPAGSFAFPTQTPLSSTPAAVAVDNDPLSPSFGDLYVADPGHGVIDKFEPSGAYVGQLTGTPGGSFAQNGDYGGPYGVAVDVDGNVWVMEPSGQVDEFDSVGIFQSSFETGCENVLPSLGVDFSDNVYITCAHSVEKFDAHGTLAGVLPRAGVLSTVAINDANDHTFVIAEGYLLEELDSNGILVWRDVPPGNRASIESQAGGVAVDAVSDAVYMSLGSGAVYRWGPLTTVPSVETRGASDVQPREAKLDGTVDPEGVQVTACRFEYGLGTNYGLTAPCSSAPGSGNGEVATSVVVSELQPNTTYHYRLVAENANGSNAGGDQTFTTTGPPTVDAEQANDLTQTGASLTARIAPRGFDTTYRFEYGSTTSYGNSAPISGEDIGAGIEDQEVAVPVSDLSAGTTYHYRVVAASSQGETSGWDQTFTTLPAARIADVSASGVGSDGATLYASIDPFGNDTTYRFEYGTSVSYGASIPVPDGDVGGAGDPVLVTQRIHGLVAGTTYHYRVVTHNVLGTTFGGDHTFVDFADSGLPDGRIYEMVTPAQKNDARIGETSFSVISQFAENGTRAMMASLQCFGDAQWCNADRDVVTGSPYVFNRQLDGWDANSLTPSAHEFEGGATPYMFDADSGSTLFSMSTPPLGEDDWYVRKPDGSLNDVGPVSPPSLGPLGGDKLGLFGMAATADFSHVIFSLGGTAQSERWPFDHGVDGFEAYEYSGSGNHQPALVGVSGPRGSTTLLSQCGTELGAGQHIFNALSSDGRVVYFTARREAPGEPCAGSAVDKLYARIDDSRSVFVSARSSQDCTGTCLISPPGDANYQGASADGSKVFFTDTQQLLNNASEDNREGDSASESGCSDTDGTNGCNLYLYDFERPTGRNLTTVSTGDSSGLGPEVQGVVAISSDGSHVYFVARGVLSTAPNARGQLARPGEDNLYAYICNSEYPDGHMGFVATLPAVDQEEWNAGIGEPANVTPDGRYLVFTSHGALTADDMRIEGPAQVYRYDALDGQLIRISVGEHGFADNGNAGNGDAQIVSPARTTFLSAGPARTDPTMSHDGTYVFFESPVGLTPGALNDVTVGNRGFYAENVYEWHDGTISLLSDGRDTGVAFGGASAVHLYRSDGTGANVFFTTVDQLVPQDTDTQFDVYDARTCTASEPCPVAPSAPLPPCLGEACHGTPAATPPPLGAASASFEGQGNVPPGAHPLSTQLHKKNVKRGSCASQKRRRRGKCVKKGGHRARKGGGQ
jgi:sugar lactone lactonase YvrE